MAKPLTAENGRFGDFGGRFVPETMMEPLEDLARAYDRIGRKRPFKRRLKDLLTHYAGRPTSLFFAERLSHQLGGARIYLKREDLLHTGSHRLNNAIGQALLAESMNKRRIIAETGCGDHGVATASAAAMLGLECSVYLSREDASRQRLNVDRMRMLGAEVVPVGAEAQTPRAAINEALRDWITNIGTTHYVPGSVLGPDPYPRMVADFNQIIGRETQRQLRRQAGRAWPDLAIACVGGGSQAIGLFGAFLDDRKVRLIGVEAGGRGSRPGEHAARFGHGSAGILQGARTLVLQDEEGQIAPTHSVAAGLNRPGVGPQHAALAGAGRVEYTAVGDQEAVDAFHLLASTEGILPTLESAHAVAELRRHAGQLSSEKIIVVNLSGRGDKDLETVMAFDRAAGRRQQGAAQDWAEATGPIAADGGEEE